MEQKANIKKASTKKANGKNEEAEGKQELSRKDYMAELRKLQTELVYLQEVRILRPEVERRLRPEWERRDGEVFTGTSSLGPPADHHPEHE